MKIRSPTEEEDFQRHWFQDLVFGWNT